MEMVFLPSARDDLAGLRRYFREHGRPEGGAAAALRLARLALGSAVRPRLAEGPVAGVRVMPLPALPFSLVLRFTASRIEVLQVRDDRR
jgi:hypothetical protein